MPRTLKEVAINTAAARGRLPVRDKAYFRALDRGLHIGFLKSKTGGSWIARRYAGEQRYDVVKLGRTDDGRNADGIAILTFEQAVAKARGLDAEKAEAARVEAMGPAVLVKDAIDAYLTVRGARAHDRGDAASALAKHVPADLRAVDLRTLTEATLRDWRSGLADKGLKPSSVRRIAADLKAALNLAGKRHKAGLPATFADTVKDGLVAVSVEPVEADDDREMFVLDDADVRRIVAAAWDVDAAEGWNGDLGRLVTVMAATGARFSQVIRMQVKDVQSRRLLIPVSRKGSGGKAAKLISFPVGQDVLDALRPAVAGRKGHETLLLRPKSERAANGIGWVSAARGAWGKSGEMQYAFKAVVAAAGLSADLTPYCLRHSSIVKMLKRGLPAQLVAKVHDTSVQMIEAHYAAHIVTALDDLLATTVIPLLPTPPTPLRAVA